MSKMIAVTFLASLTLGGCIIVTDREDWDDLEIYGGTGWEARQNRNHELISQLALGSAVGLIRADLGEPDFTEAYRADANDYLVLRYRTQHRRSDGDTTYDETTPLLFENGLLVGWGETVVSQAMPYADHNAPQPEAVGQH